MKKLFLPIFAAASISSFLWSNLPAQAAIQETDKSFYVLQTLKEAVESADKKPDIKTCHIGIISEDEISKIKIKDDQIAYINQIPKDYSIVNSGGKIYNKYQVLAHLLAKTDSDSATALDQDTTYNYICIVKNKQKQEFYVFYNKLNGFFYYPTQP